MSMQFSFTNWVSVLKVKHLQFNNSLCNENADNYSNYKNKIIYIIYLNRLNILCMHFPLYQLVRFKNKRELVSVWALNWTELKWKYFVCSSLKCTYVNYNLSIHVWRNRNYIFCRCSSQTIKWRITWFSFNFSRPIHNKHSWVLIFSRLVSSTYQIMLMYTRILIPQEFS